MVERYYFQIVKESLTSEHTENNKRLKESSK